MTSPPPAVILDQQQASANDAPFQRRLFLVLAVVALAYAFFAGLRTVQDFDLGWQMATGRWAIEHHQVPRVDVLSYTMPSEPWNYPLGSEVIFYLAYRLGGFALISWIGAAACVGTIAILLRRNSAAGAAIAILAVPLIAARTTPRADMFSIVLFAAYLSLLWENYQTGRARLWLLPVLMIAWANLHFGFASGLALIVAYVAAELLEMAFGAERRRVALDKLRRAWPWLAATALATLQLNQPEKAGNAFDKAAHSTPSALRAADNGFFEFKVAQGRAPAADALGNLDRAIVYQEEAANIEPNVPAPWRRLAKMYERAGRAEDANRARQHAAEAEKQPQH